MEEPCHKYVEPPEEQLVPSLSVEARKFKSEDDGF